MISSFINKQVNRGKQAISNTTKNFGSALASLSPALGANLNQVMPGTVTEATPSNTFQPKTQSQQQYQPNQVLMGVNPVTTNITPKPPQAKLPAMRTGVSSGGGAMSAPAISPQEQMMIDEDNRKRVEQEAKNESFRQSLSGEYGNLRAKFGNIVGQFTQKLQDYPNTLKELGRQYKATIGEKQTQELGQVEQKRQQVQAQQKQGLSQIADQARKGIQSGARRLGALGMASSAAGMFQKAIQATANKSAQDLLVQAANNYQNLDNETKKVKSAYSTMLQQVDNEENENLKQIQESIPQIIQQINEDLQKSGELERMDRQDLNNVHLNAIQSRYQEATSRAEAMKQQLNQWRRQNENNVLELKNRIVQDFIPQQLVPKDLFKRPAEARTPAPSQEEAPFGLPALRNVPEEEEELTSPRTLQDIVRRRRENNQEM
jgi:hypothetical protein